MTTEPAPTGRSIDEIPGPKGVPVLGNMFDVPADRTIQTAMELVREYGPMVRLQTPVGDRFIASPMNERSTSAPKTRAAMAMTESSSKS